MSPAGCLPRRALPAVDRRRSRLSNFRLPSLTYGRDRGLHGHGHDQPTERHDSDRRNGERSWTGSPRFRLAGAFGGLGHVFHNAPGRSGTR